MTWMHEERPVTPVDQTITTTALLDGLHDQGNRAVWSEFDRRYRPILVAFLRRMGLDENDAGDVAQDTLTCFVQDYRRHKYDRQQGRLRSWLIGIARCRLADLRRTTKRRRELRGESAMVGLPAEADAESVWEAEERRYVFEQAISELRSTSRFNERTIGAFERVVLRSEPVETVSAELGLTPQEIYNAKNRVVERLRDIVKRYEHGYVGG
ncbi:MAG TPA: RNA polymerase sigma factor [Phycisphaerae bacterium]|jgi:RNA polymerase sigma-70 factor (ECF subfamily)